MKTFKLFALVGIFLTLRVSSPTQAFCSEQTYRAELPNYVVIGAFAIHKNAIRFASYATKDLNIKAKYERHTSRNLYYVYVLNTPNLEEAIGEAKRLRQESEFIDTWVYSGWFGEQPVVSEQQVVAAADVNPITKEKMDEVTVADEVSDPTNGTETAQHTSDKESTKVIPIIDDGKPGKVFYFELKRAQDNNMVEGDVSVIDLDRSRKMATYKGNTQAKVVDPASKTDSISLVCEVFGYRKVQQNLSYANPNGEGITQNGEGATVVPFELVRLQKGDIAVMYNVYFFKDASIMRPESRYEVNSLLAMLNENPKYKIRIHGHTNGGATGKIISMSKGSDNFFSLNDTKEGIGSAKKLSEERAQIIRDYLVSNGIEPSRTIIKAWGGKRPIHDKLSTRAQENVRVEIEILEH